MVEIFYAMTLSQAIILQIGTIKSLENLSTFKNSVLHKDVSQLFPNTHIIIHTIKCKFTYIPSAQSKLPSLIIQQVIFQNKNI